MIRSIAWTLASALVLVSASLGQEEGVAAVRGDLAAPMSEPLVDAAPSSHGVAVWGLLGVRGDATGTRMAPNGVPYRPLFAADLDLNIGLEKCENAYLFINNRFWGQKPGDGITNSNFDFSKREFDVNTGLAWNYWGNFELRGFVYALNNLNRGVSVERPYGFRDGCGIENRYYLGNLTGPYAPPVRTRYDVARTNFVSIGYYPSKGMPGGDGNEFVPGFFARAFLTLDLLGEKCYLYCDTQLICEDGFAGKLIDADLGVASRPLNCLRGLEFRIGTEGVYDIAEGISRPLFYGAVRLVF